jgi:hypothetical protein
MIRHAAISSCSLSYSFQSSLFGPRAQLREPAFTSQIDTECRSAVSRTVGPNVPVDLLTPQSHTSIQEIDPVRAGACSRHTNHRLCCEAEDVACQLDNHTGDGVRLLRQLLLSKEEHTASSSRADMDGDHLRNEGVVGKAVFLTSNVSDCSLGSKDQLTQSRKQRVIKQAREGLANPLLRDSRCLT